MVLVQHHVDGKSKVDLKAFSLQRLDLSN